MSSSCIKLGTHVCQAQEQKIPQNGHFAPEKMRTVGIEAQCSLDAQRAEDDFFANDEVNR